MIITSPPYWRKRDYEIPGQIGQETTEGEYIGSLIACLGEWRRVLRPTGSVFLNIGDSFRDRRLAGIPARLELAARDRGWMIRNRIVWVKDGGVPESVRNRLSCRHEYILHLVRQHNYYYDLFGYAERFGNGSNPGDVWSFKPARNGAEHLAPFPDELVERAIFLGCPYEVCSACGRPRRRIVRRTAALDPGRPQARRALELAEAAGLRPEHIAAIQATGISDAGKAARVQVGAGKNSGRVVALAAEAKRQLRGYFREFTFAPKETVGWTICKCGAPGRPGMVLDPFAGSGTTPRVATRLGRRAIGVDLRPETVANTAPLDGHGRSGRRVKAHGIAAAQRMQTGMDRTRPASK